MSETYDPSDEGPEAKFAREEIRRQERLEAHLDNFLYSLRPEDASRVLFTWAQIKYWLLKRKH